MKQAIIIGLILLMSIVVGCKDSVDDYDNTTNASFRIFRSNKTFPSIAFSGDQLIIENMDCYPVSCPSNLCLECRIDNESVNFTGWFNYDSKNVRR